MRSRAATGKRDLMEAYVTGAGWVTPAGSGQGRTSAFSWGKGDLPSIARKQVFSDPYPHFGRMDRYSRLGVAAVALALRDAGVEHQSRSRPVALIGSTVRGCIETDIAFFKAVRTQGPQYASPHLFAYTLANTFLGEAAIRFNLAGPTFILNEPDHGGLFALTMALTMIDNGESPVAVTGVCDLNSPSPQVDSMAGALFFVLEQTADEDRSYGRLVRSSGGDLAFQDRKVVDMTTLAGCLSEGSEL